MSKVKRINKAIFDGSCYDYLMRVNGFSCGLNTPAALSGDQTFRLPPYCKRMPYLVDKYPACPSDWMRSEGKIKSYFVPVKEGSGMWLDFNDNATKNNHVAVVVSVQGINPITGLPCKDAQIEQYIEECPKHKIKFGPDRYCKKCDYKWPKQNYLSTTGTPNGQFWLDGFRSIDGMVRQYVLTSEKMRGVASNIIGKDRVFAIGISFFTSKEKKPTLDQTQVLRNNHLSYIPPFSYTPPDGIETAQGSPKFYSTSINWQTPVKNTTSGLTKGTTSYDSVDIKFCSTSSVKEDTDFLSFIESPNLTAGSWDESTFKDTRSIRTKNILKGKTAQHKIDSPVRCKQLDVGAGAKIQQSIHDDTERLEFWHGDAEGIICVNYCAESDCVKILEQGEIELEGHPEGFMKEIPVGN